MELFRLTFPHQEICNEQEMYFRANPSLNGDDGVSYDERKEEITCNCHAVISLDTYFNCFSYAKYLKYTWVDTVGIALALNGRFTVRLIASRTKGAEREQEVLQEHLVEHQEMSEYRFTYNFSEDLTEGLYYVELTALSDGAVFSGGYYFADETGHDLSPVKMAVVICTYKREGFVYRNIGLAKDYFIRHSHSAVPEKLSFFIVDNGHTIDETRVANRNVTVFKNKNYGGSGGFTRGIIEAFWRKNEYTHVLLMDDDILFEIETLVKTINFLQVLKTEYLDICLGAAMLREDMKYLQYEAGAWRQGMKVERRKPDFDLRVRDKLILNEKEEPINYSGWWYMCIPIRLINEKKLPLPFFIKIDDMEYGIRLAQKIIQMNGLGVWHEHFDLKYNAYLQYYVKRNGLILNAVHFPQYGALDSIKTLMFAVGKQLVMRKYSAHHYLFRAYRDFLKGIDFLLQTDQEEINKELIHLGKRPFHDGSIAYFPFMMVIVLFQFIVLSIRLLFKYQQAAETYRNRMTEITSIDFWCRHLGLKEELGNDSDIN